MAEAILFSIICAMFTQCYSAEVCEVLGVPVPKQMPPYSTFRRVMLGLNFVQFAKLFNR